MIEKVISLPPTLKFPLKGYIYHRLNREESFSLKGREEVTLYKVSRFDCLEMEAFLALQCAINKIKRLKKMQTSAKKGQRTIYVTYKDE